MKLTTWVYRGALALLVVGCAPPPSTTWLREDVHPKTVKGDRQLDRVKIWTGDSVLQWHAVVVTRDSISGIPSRQPQQCSPSADRCRRALPVSAVDSLFVGYRKEHGSDDHDVLWITLLVLGVLFTP